MLLNNNEEQWLYIKNTPVDEDNKTYKKILHELINTLTKYFHVVKCNKNRLEWYQVNIHNFTSIEFDEIFDSEFNDIKWIQTKNKNNTVEKEKYELKNNYGLTLFSVSTLSSPLLRNIDHVHIFGYDNKGIEEEIHIDVNVDVYAIAFHSVSIHFVVYHHKASFLEYQGDFSNPLIHMIHKLE